MRTSDFLVEGEIYTRDQLRETFAITDQTLNTGIFKPPGHDSIWLFITEKKTGGMTEYEDLLQGDKLYWQGQMAGLKDRQIIEHGSQSLELLVFYRPEKSTYPGSGFRFEGPFEYMSHSGMSPTSFVLRRGSIPSTAEGIRAVSAFDDSETSVQSSVKSLIQRLIELRQSGSSAVVSEAGFTQLQEMTHIPDAIEVWIIERIRLWRERNSNQPLLIMLSGNAGDGKSNLIERLVPRISDNDDVSVIADATHAESPTDDQTATLAEFFRPFADDSGAQPKVSLIAMNTGMALSFFASVADGNYSERYKTLEQVVRNELGLARTDVSPPWEYEIINLDLRSVLPHSSTALFTGMLDKLKLSNPRGIVFEEGKACESCCVRQCCFVHTNVQALAVPQVRTNLIDRLWSASLSAGVHLSPRNMWDFLYQVTTGGAEFFSDVSTPCEKIVQLSSAGTEGMEDLHRRLLYNLVFESPDPQIPRGPVLSALESTDPIRRVGPNGHEAESAAYNDPAIDSRGLALAAREVAVGATGDESAPPDPCLDYLSVLLKSETSPSLAAKKVIAKGVLRRAALFGTAGLSEELVDGELGDFLALLDAYRNWTIADDAPEAIYEYKALLEEAIASIFGAKTNGGETYFRQDSFSPSSRYAVYTRVDLAQAIVPIMDPNIARAPGWLDALNFRPQSINVQIMTSEVGSHIRGDFALYRLCRRVAAGYAASSVDLEAFFGLRFACERLGGTYSDATELVVRDLESGVVYRLREKTVMNKVKLELTQESETAS